MHVPFALYMYSIVFKNIYTFTSWIFFTTNGQVTKYGNFVDVDFLPNNNIFCLRFIFGILVNLPFKGQCFVNSSEL